MEKVIVCEISYLNNAINGNNIIELLVVIVIIVILAAILFPIFARARKNARRASCQGNEKNFAPGFKQYIQDWNDKYPPTIADSYALKTSSSGALSSYIKSSAIFYCPSDSNKTIGSYGYSNAEVAGKKESSLLPRIQSTPEVNTILAALRFQRYRTKISPSCIPAPTDRRFSTSKTAAGS